MTHNTHFAKLDTRGKLYSKNISILSQDGTIAPTRLTKKVRHINDPLIAQIWTVKK